MLIGVAQMMMELLFAIGIPSCPRTPPPPPPPPEPFFEMRRLPRILRTYALISFCILMGLISPVRLWQIYSRKQNHTAGRVTKMRL